MTCKPVHYKVTVLKLTDLRVLPTDNDSVMEGRILGVWGLNPEWFSQVG